MRLTVPDEKIAVLGKKELTNEARSDKITERSCGGEGALRG